MTRRFTYNCKNYDDSIIHVLKKEGLLGFEGRGDYPLCFFIRPAPDAGRMNYYYANESCPLVQIYRNMFVHY